MDREVVPVLPVLMHARFDCFFITGPATVTFYETDSTDVAVSAGEYQGILSSSHIHG